MEREFEEKGREEKRWEEESGGLLLIGVPTNVPPFLFVQLTFLLLSMCFIHTLHQPSMVT